MYFQLAIQGGAVTTAGSEAAVTQFSYGHVIGTAVLVAGGLALRSFLNRRVRNAQGLRPELRRRWLVQIRRGVILLTTVGLVVIWATELRLAAVSLLAIAAAVVIAVKELLMCISGSMVRANSDAFSIGDRIEVKGLRGDVIDQSLFTTTMLEIGPGKLTNLLTGRAITIPNSVFLSEPVANDTFTNEYVLHVFTIPMGIDSDWRRAEHVLLDAAGDACAPYLEDARKHMAEMSANLGLPTPSIEPRVTLQFPEPEVIDLVVRMAAPSRHKGRIEQVILRRFAEAMAPRKTDG